MCIQIHQGTSTERSDDTSGFRPPSSAYPRRLVCDTMPRKDPPVRHRRGKRHLVRARASACGADARARHQDSATIRPCRRRRGGGGCRIRRRYRRRGAVNSRRRIPMLNLSRSRRNFSFTLSLFARINNFVSTLFSRIRDMSIPPPTTLRRDFPPGSTSITSLSMSSPLSPPLIPPRAAHATIADRYSLTLRWNALECSGALETSEPTS